ALFTHCLRGQEIIIGKGYHIVTHEVGAPAVIAGVQLRTIDEENKIIDSIKRVPFSISRVRQVLPGHDYSLPPEQNKLNPLDN
ncbi:NFACT family protein, partial [Clostridioides difficile]